MFALLRVPSVKSLAPLNPKNLISPCHYMPEAVIYKYFDFQVHNNGASGLFLGWVDHWWRTNKYTRGRGFIFGINPFLKERKNPTAPPKCLKRWK